MKEKNESLRENGFVDTCLAGLESRLWHVNEKENWKILSTTHESVHTKS